MKKLVVLLLAVVCLAACSKSPMLVIEADGCPDNEGKVVLTMLGTDEVIDSARIENGAFRMELNDLNPNEVYKLAIRSTNLRMTEYIFAEKGKLYLDMQTDQMTGTPLAEALSSLFFQMNQEETQDSYLCRMKESYAEHKDDLMGAVLLFYLAYDLPADEVMAMYDNASEIVKNTAFMQKTAAVWAIQAQSAPGQKYIDIEVPFEGQTQRLSDYIGNGRKLTIVDFWASWCGPCKEEIPYLKAVYERYKDQGVEVVGVATWDEPAATRKAIEALAIPYPQILNAQRIGSDAYGIQGIPEILLIGEDGTILARGLRGAEIEEAVIMNLQ